MDFTTLQNDFTNDYQKALIANNEFLEAKKYYNGNQLPQDVLNIILDRGQTPIVENMFKVIVNKILGYKIESISEIRLSPKQEEDRALSDLLNSLLQVFIQSENYDKAMIERDKNLLIGGLGVIQLWVNEDKDKNVEIDIKALKPESFIIDYFSTDKNALDARRFHKMLEITEQEALLLFGDSVIINYSSVNHERIASVVESWYKEYNEETNSYQWNRYLWSRSAGVYKSELKPFKNGACPFVISKLYTDELNNYYGLFRDIKPMQDFINYAENRMGNMMGSFKAMFEEDAVVDVAEFVETMSLGMDLNVNLNGNLNITSENQTRVKNLTSATSKIYDGIKALNLGDRLIEKAQDNSGIFSALKRFANEKTNGFYGLNSDEAETVNALKNYSYSTARQMGGQLTNQKIKDAQEMTKFGFRSKEENTARLGENQGRLIQILEQDINNLESLGGKVPESVILELLKHKKRLEHIQKNQGKIKLKEYQQINHYSEHEQDDGK